MQTASVFRYGSSQAVRLPEEFHFDEDEVVVARPAPMVLWLLAFGVLHACLCRWLAPAWPAGVVARALRLAGLVFALSFAFWEFFTPFNQFGEPLPLLALELAFWAAVALADGFAVAAVAEAGPQ